MYRLISFSHQPDDEEGITIPSLWKGEVKHIGPQLVGSWVRIMMIEGMLILKFNLLWLLWSHSPGLGLFLQ